MELNLPIAVTMGDPTGIGPEIAVKVISKCDLPILLYGNLKILKSVANKLNLKIPEEKIVNTIKLNKREFSEIKIGEPSNLSGQVSYSAISYAVKDCMNNKVQAVVTGPISKLALNLAGHKWPGHTELLSYLSRPENPPRVRMALLSDNLLIVLNSIHLSLKNAINELTTKQIVETLT